MNTSTARVCGRGACLLGPLALLAVVAWPASARADLPPEDPSSRPPLHTVTPRPEKPPSPMYTGQYAALAGGGGLLFADDSGAESPGLDGRIAGRWSPVLQIFDIEAHVGLGLMRVGPAKDVQRRLGVGAQLNLHPFFIGLIWNNVWGVLASGLHGFLGADIAHVSGAGLGLRTVIGVGADIPLMSLQSSGGVWLTFRASERWLSAGPAGDEVDAGDRRLSAFISWRWYDVLGR